MMRVPFSFGLLSLAIATVAFRLDPGAFDDCSDAFAFACIDSKCSIRILRIQADLFVWPQCDYCTQTVCSAYGRRISVSPEKYNEETISKWKQQSQWVANMWGQFSFKLTLQRHFTHFCSPCDATIGCHSCPFS